MTLIMRSDYILMTKSYYYKMQLNPTQFIPVQLVLICLYLHSIEKGEQIHFIRKKMKLSHWCRLCTGAAKEMQIRT